jgi:N-acyl-D-aspartate/D-glutamate deacylase
VTHDLILRGGTIVDGLGSPTFVGDVAIDGDRITAMGAVPGSARREFDARGAIVTPGFVDLHTHFDAQIGWDPLLTPSSWHGVTTVLIGNCGMTFAPVRPDECAQLAHLMEAVEDIPAETILSGLPWSWTTYGEYLDCIEQLRPALNVAGMIGHCALRYFVMGERAVDGRPDEDDLREMSAVVAEAIADGAVGFSTSRYLEHRLPDGRHVPGTSADRTEILAIAKGLNQDSIFQAVVNFEQFADEMSLLSAVSDASGASILMTAAVTQDPRSGLNLRRAIEKMRSGGTRVTATITPRAGGVVIGLPTIFPWQGPVWLRLYGLDLEQRLDVLDDPDARAELIADANEGSPVFPLDLIFPIERDGTTQYMAAASESLEGLARRTGKPAAEVFIDLTRASRGRAMFNVRLFNRNLDALAELLPSDCVLPGLGDAGAHVGQVMDAGWTTFFLAHWVRDTGTFDLADGVRRLTSAPANLIGLGDRGRLAPGAIADVNVIDLDALRPLSVDYVHDFPGGAGRLVQHAQGYRATLVNGQVLIQNDEVTGAHSGRVLRSGRPA